MIEAALVIAVVFSAIVERRAVGPERGCNQHFFFRKFCACLCGNVDGAQESLVSALGGKTIFGIPFPGDLVARSEQKIRTGLKISAMHGSDLFRRIFEDMRGPERTGDIGAEEFKLGGHSAIKHSSVIERNLAAELHASMMSSMATSSLREPG